MLTRGNSLRVLEKMAALRSHFAFPEQALPVKKIRLQNRRLIFEEVLGGRR
jgi:hypothetical protein